MTTNTTPVLLHLQDKAIRSHNWTSFSPEKRGEQMIKEYSKELTEDMEELKAQGTSEESVNDYKARYERYFASYLHAKSNCFSVMITGGSNFPVRRHEKTKRSEERHYTIFREWRLRAKKAIVRKAQPVKTYTSELERYRAELAGMQCNHELMKEGNKRIKAAQKSGADLTQYLTDTFNIPAHMIEHTMRWGFGLTNNNANMKRIEGMIKTLEQKEALKEQTPITNYTFEGGTMIVNYEVDRVQIFFSNRPTRDELNAWKSKGLNTFNWSPSANAWQRKITPNCFRCVKSMLPGITKVTD